MTMASTVSLNPSVDKNSFIYNDYCHISKHQWMSLDPTSLPDAKAAEDVIEHILHGEFARDGVEGALRQA